MENSKYYALVKFNENNVVYENEQIQFFKQTIKQYLKSIDITADFDDNRLIFQKDIGIDGFDKIMAFILELPTISEDNKFLLKNRVSLDSFFSKLNHPIYFNNIMDIFEELSLRGIHFDFNDCEDSDKTLVAIDADDRVKFIPYKKYKFEQDLDQLISRLIQSCNGVFELESFVKIKIKNFLISESKLEINDNMLNYYLHMLDYLRADSFNNEIGLQGLHGCNYETISNNVKVWSVAASKKRIKDSLTDRKQVYSAYGFDWYQLLTPASLDYESSVMGHCVGQGGYDKQVKINQTQIYSLRDEANNPHVTIEITNGKMVQVKGKSNRQINEKYRKSTISFIVNFLGIPVNEIPDGIRSFVLISNGENPMPLVFNDPEYLTYFMVGQSYSSIEYIIHELVKDEAKLFNYDIDQVTEKLVKLSLAKFGTMPGSDIIIDSLNYKLIQIHVIPKIPKDLDPQLFAKLYKISALSELRAWSMDFLRPILSKAKYKNQSKELLELAEGISIIFGIPLIEFLDQLMNETVEIYRGVRKNTFLEWAGELNEMVLLIGTMKESAKSANYATAIDFKRVSIDIPRIGCDECDNEGSVKDMNKYKEQIESSLSDIEEYSEQISNILSEGSGLIQDIAEFCEEIASHVTIDNLIDHKEYFDNKNLKNLDLKVQEFEKRFKEDAWIHRYSSRSVKISDYNDVISGLQKTIKNLQNEIEDFNSVDVMQCDECNRKSERQSLSIPDVILEIDIEILNFSDGLDTIIGKMLPIINKISVLVEEYIQQEVKNILFFS